MELSMTADWGVLGEDCKAMDMIWAQELVDGGWVAGKVWSANGGEASRFKSTPIAPQPLEDERSNGEEHHCATVHRNESGGVRAAWVRPAGPTPWSVGLGFWVMLIRCLLSTVLGVTCLWMEREEKKREEKGSSLG